MGREGKINKRTLRIRSFSFLDCSAQNVLKAKINNNHIIITVKECANESSFIVKCVMSRLRELKMGGETPPP